MSTTNPLPSVNGIVHRLIVRQMPTEARASSKRGERRALTPMPAVELELWDTSLGRDTRIPVAEYCTTTYVLDADLENASTGEVLDFLPDATPVLCGATVTSLFCVPGEGDSLRAFFAFSDLGVLRVAGNPPMRLRFSLASVDAKGIRTKCSTIVSSEFRIVSNSGYQGVQETTELTRFLAKHHGGSVRKRAAPAAARSGSTRARRGAHSMASTSPRSIRRSLSASSTILRPNFPASPPDDSLSESSSPQMLHPRTLSLPLVLPILAPRPRHASTSRLGGPATVARLNKAADDQLRALTHRARAFDSQDERAAIDNDGGRRSASWAGYPSGSRTADLGRRRSSAAFHHRNSANWRSSDWDTRSSGST